MKKILVVDDEKQISRVLKTTLQSSGHAVTAAENGLAGYDAFVASRHDLVITDLAMPEMNGLELTRAIRRSSTVPIIVLSVRNTEAMKVAALDDGADDYLTKPFSMPELLARVRVQLRRSALADEAVPAQIQAGDFLIDAAAHTVFIRGNPVHLTPKEFDLLLLFARSPGRVLTHKTILRAVWGPAGDDQPEYLRVLIAGLRKKIGTSPERNYIRSEPWVGYRFDPTGKDSLLSS